jgi:gliding motility-associated-like protein
MNKKTLFLFLLLCLCSYGYSQQASRFYFYKGDTLTGFDVPACIEDAKHHHYDGPDLQLYLHHQEKLFVAHKYNLPVEHPASDTRLVEPDRVLTSACNNVDFENGNFNGWVGAYGYNSNSSGPLSVPFGQNAINSGGLNAPEPSCSYHTLQSPAGGTDPYSGLPVVDPGGGGYSARLGGEWVNICSSYWGPLAGNSCRAGRQAGGPYEYSGGEILQQTFVVTKANSLFSYNYSVVMDEANHSAGEQPYFRVEVFDASNNPLPCLQYYVESINNVAPPGFIYSPKQDINLVQAGNFSPNRVYYCPWTSNSINLSPYVGSSITVKFTAAGCLIGGHFAYAYVDASCGPVQIKTNLGSPCAGQSVTLTAPSTGAGGSYQWSTLPSGTAGIVSATNGQSVTVNATGTYEVLVKLSNGCKYTIDTTITFSPLPAFTLTPINPVCNGSNNGSITVNTTAGVAPFTYSWKPNPGIGQGTPTASGLSPGTYSVTVTSATGCKATGQTSISQPPALNATANTTPVSCNGGSDGSATISVSGSAGPFTYTWTPIGGSGATASGLPKGTYGCTVTDANGCSTKTTAVITEPAVLSVSCIPTNIACHGGTVGSAVANVSGGTAGYTYIWSPAGGNAATANNLPAGTYTCSVTDTHNCKASASTSITEPPDITLSTSSTPTPCAGLTGSATANAAGGTGTLTYSWSPGGGTTSTITVITSGIYTVTVKDANGCTKIATAPVSNTGGPIATPPKVSNVSCYGLTDGSITVHGSGGTGTITYSWSPMGGSGVNDTTNTGLPSGTYNVQIIDAAGCQVIQTITISTPSQISAFTSTTPASCNNGSDGTATVNPSGGSPGYSYSWTPLGGTGITGTGLSAGNYTCTITDTKGCKATVTATVTQPGGLLVSNTTKPVTCFGGADGTASVNASGGTPGYAYTWTPSGGTAANAAGLSAGNYTCTVTDSKGCITQSIANVTAPTAITSAVSSVPATCFGNSDGSVTIVASGGTPGYSYTWSPGGSGATTVSGLPAGTYTCTITDAAACSFVSSVFLGEPKILTAGNTSSDITCNGLKNGSTTINPAGGTKPYTYSWSPGGATTQTITGLGAGNYTCMVTDVNGCTVNSVDSISEPSAINLSLSNGVVPCFGASTGKDTASAIGGTGILSYSWTPSGGSTYIGTGLSVGTYTCTVQDGNGCTLSQTVTVTQTAQINGNPKTVNAICTASNGSAIVTPTGGLGNYDYSWSPGGAITDSISMVPAGSYTCTITDTAGCSVKVMVVIASGIGNLTAHFGGSPVIGVAPVNISFVDSSKVAPTTWTWDFGDGTLGSGANPSHNYTVPGTYTVSETVTDANGCKSTTSITVDITPLASWIKIPNVFTPNDDGSNDTWQISYQGISAFNAKIYDRWGVLITELVAPGSVWDGRTIGGSPCVAGTYYYVIHADGTDAKTYDFTGFMMLIRP